MSPFEALTLREEAVKAEEEALRLAVSRLPDQKRAHYFRRFNREVKDPDTYAVLNWLLLAGLHHFYLGRYVRGLVNLAVMVSGLGLVLAGVNWGWPLILVILILELPALFRSQLIVLDHNNRLGKRLLAEE